MTDRGNSNSSDYMNNFYKLYNNKYTGDIFFFIIMIIVYIIYIKYIANPALCQPSLPPIDPTRPSLPPIDSMRFPLPPIDQMRPPLPPFDPAKPPLRPIDPSLPPIYIMKDPSACLPQVLADPDKAIDWAITLPPITDTHIGVKAPVVRVKIPNPETGVLQEYKKLQYPQPLRKSGNGWVQYWAHEYKLNAMAKESLKKF